MKTKSVSSNPICPPNPAPPVAIAVGALQLPSGRRATTRPLPNRAEPRKPAFITVRIARPWGLSNASITIQERPRKDRRSYLSVSEYGWRNDFFGPQWLARVNERGQNLAALLAFGFTSSCQLCRLRGWGPFSPAPRKARPSLHAKDDGRGLLRPMATKMLPMRAPGIR